MICLRGGVMKAALRYFSCTIAAYEFCETRSVRV
jgi:hypothetical protein